MSRATITPIEWTSTSSSPVQLPNEQVKDLAREDGELSDGDSDPDDYNILPRPTHLLPAAKIPGVNNNVISEPVDAVVMKPSEELIYSDEEEDFHNDSDSDSDEDHPALKKRMEPSSFSNSGPFRNPNAAGFVADETKTPTECEEKMMNFQQKRKVNNIWGDLLMEEQEQQALEKFGSIDVEGKQVLIERGPESYTFKPGTTGQLGKRKRHMKVGKKGPKRNDDDSDVSSTALSDDDLSYIRRKKESSGGAAGGSRGKIKSGFSETGELLVSEVRDRLGKIKGRKLAYLMARELEEPKTQLIVRAVEILGKYYCIDLFIKTLKIEKRGGLLVKTQARRRTPGGIFFYMLRKDDRYPPEKVQSVFEVDKQIVSREKRNIRAAKRKEQKAKVERLQHRVDKMKGTKPMDEEKKDCDENVEEDGELPSYEGSSASDSDSDDSEIDDDDIAHSDQYPDLANEASNDYLDIHCDIDEFTDL